MNIRSLSPLAVALGVWIADGAVAPALATAVEAAVPANQSLADNVAQHVVTHADADGADISLEVTDGVVTVRGTATTPAQKSSILQAIRVVPGVKMVRDGLKLGNPVTQVQASGRFGPTETSPPTGAIPSGPVGGMPGQGPVIEPVPLGQGGAGPAGNFAPPLPPYAWPTYAPHNNVSRVAYPQAYPYNAFPFIGPFYPFPKVPPGWRKVTLEWEDGHWWMGRTSAPRDYWKVRFW